MGGVGGGRGRRGGPPVRTSTATEAASAAPTSTRLSRQPAPPSAAGDGGGDGGADLAAESPSSLACLSPGMPCDGHVWLWSTPYLVGVGVRARA